MLENCKSARERWGGVNGLIDQWLHARQKLLVLFYGLASEGAYSDENKEQCKQLESLCEELVDYVSAGHFEVYDQLVKEGEEFEDLIGIEAAKEQLEIIDPTTDALLDFNDKYQVADDLSALKRDLSKVGEILETRFAAEDNMISVLHAAHSEEASTSDQVT